MISGQRKTLSRLGVSFDKVIFESDFLPEVRELTNTGLSVGTLTRRHGDRMVMYETEREELEEMPLVRADGLPTQHMRALAYWAAGPELDEFTSLQVCGTEWFSHVTCRRQLMDALGVGLAANGHGSARGGGFPTHDVFHGMVARERETITSSKEGALLIDDLAEWVETEISGDPQRASVRQGHPHPDRIPAQVALGYFLLQPTTKRVDFEPSKLLNEGRSLGWDLARAQSDHGASKPDAGSPAEDPDYRFARGPGGDASAAPARRRRRPRRAGTGTLPLALRPLVQRRAANAGGAAGGRRGAGARPGRAGAGGGVMRTLLVDNHDSYTYNVFHLLAAASGEEPVVVNNDAISWRVLSRSDFDAFVLSPGPGRPERWHDFGVCRDILRYSKIPVLGICLGHQGLGNALEGGVSSAPEAMHGRLSHVRHDGSGLFAGIPQDFSVVRYHSLAITRPMGPQGHEVAWADDGVVMGIEHRERPMWGVQFHPESVATEFGRAIAENFYALAERRAAIAPRRPRERPNPTGRRDDFASYADENVPSAPGAGGLRLGVRELEGAAPTEQVYERLFGDAEHSFWLDSADAPTWLAQCSYMGTSAGAEQCLLSYDVETGEVTADRGGSRTTEQRSIFDLLDRELALHQIEPPAGIDRGLVGGWVDYLGYECKADCGARNQHRSDLPDAAFLFANRVVAVDHAKDRTFLFALGREGDAEAERWLDQAGALVAAMIDSPPVPVPLAAPEDPDAEVRFRIGRGRERYLADILRSQSELAAGESYEVCLTDQISTDAAPDPFQLYRLLRRRNPAPFAAFLRFGENAIVSSSPERFLSVDRDRTVQARPIKGTISRSDDAEADAERRAFLAGDEKTKAEHLMIVDLLRNDLGRVCELESVSVPDLMVVEPYATVHQVVSTITGKLESHRSAAECVRACFPGGSMTGAPKERTLEIIDGLETEARGVYSGAIGYFGLDGSTDLSIVIRTIVMRPGRTTIGAGGAIVMQSDPEEEFDEILLKARAPMSAIAEAVSGRAAEGEGWSVELEPALAVRSAGAA